MRMPEISMDELTRFLGDLIEEVIAGNIQVRLGRDILLARLRSFLKRWKVAGDPSTLLDEWAKTLNQALLCKNYLVKYIPATDSLSFQWVPSLESTSWATEIRTQNLKRELCDSISNLSFAAFEHLMRQVFVKTQWAQGVAVTKISHDDGIDFAGKFVEKSSGLLLPLVGQAKHWKTKVGSEEIRTFLGSIAVRNDHRNTVGVYVSTHGFTDEALRMIRKSPNQIICLDLDRLADHMITNKIGVSRISIKGMDLDSAFWNDLDV
jgi:restriction endonuclease Mrr